MHAVCKHGLHQRPGFVHFVHIICLQGGAAGLTLTAASTAVILEPVVRPTLTFECMVHIHGALYVNPHSLSCACTALACGLWDAGSMHTYGCVLGVWPMA